MRIALVCPYDYSLPGGVQTHLASLSKRFEEMGHEVSILAPCSGRPPYQEVAGVKVYDFGRSIPWPSAGSYARITLSIWHVGKLRRLLVPKNFDIVHIHEALTAVLPLMCCWWASVPIVGTFHSYNDKRPLAYSIWKPILRRASRHLDGRIAVSKPACDYVNHHFPADYRIIPNGLDVAHFAEPGPRPAVFNQNNINLLFVGRLKERRKGLRYLVEAYSKLRPRYPNLRLIVVGFGSADRGSRRLIRKYALDDVVFVGGLNFQELPAHYQAADIFCAPNTGQESFGLVLAEAMSAGTPIVASDIPGFRTVVSDNETALLAPPKNAAALASSIERLIKEPELGQRLAASAKKRVERFRWETVAEKVLSLYKEVLANNNTHHLNTNHVVGS